MKHISKIVAVILLFGVHFLAAQPPKEMKKELKTYFKETIFPVLKVQRADFENKLSQTDKEKIIELRKQLKVIRPQLKGLKKKYHHSDTELSEEERQKMHQVHSQVRKIMLQAWVIADNYENELRSIKENNQITIQKWKDDLKAIMEKYKKNYDHKGKHKHRKGHHKMMSPPRFILFDPNANPSDFENLNDEEDNDFGDDKIENKIFPNPSFQDNSLNFVMQESGKVQISLQDKDGKTVKEIIDEDRSKGEHQVRVDLSGLQKGLYFYKIQTKEGVQIQKFVKE